MDLQCTEGAADCAAGQYGVHPHGPYLAPLCGEQLPDLVGRAAEDFAGLVRHAECSGTGSQTGACRHRHFQK